MGRQQVALLVTVLILMILHPITAEAQQHNATNASPLTEIHHVDQSHGHVHVPTIELSDNGPAKIIVDAVETFHEAINAQHQGIVGVAKADQ